MADSESYETVDPTEDHLATAQRLLAGISMDHQHPSRTEQATVHALIDIAQSLRRIASATEREG